jgi:integrase
MPRKKLTATAIPHLEPGEWYDTIVVGLVLSVGKKRRTWYCRFHGGGTYRRERLGHFPVLELGPARDAARLMIERADRGLPVRSEPAPHPRSPNVLSLGALLDRYEAMRQREGHRVKALPKSMRALRLHLKPYLSAPASEFTKVELRQVRDALIDAGTPTAMNRLLASLGPALRWAVEEDLVEVNVVPAIRRLKEAERERVLTRVEIKRIWRACGRLGPHEVAINYGRLVKFLLITAQRRDEAGSMKFGDVLNHVWRQVENKASRPHSIPLPPLARALVGTGDARAYVFGGRSGGKIGAFSKLKRMLDEVSGVSDWRLHDARRTAASSMQDLGVREDIVRAVLNHALPGVAAIYLRGALEQQKATALAQWATALIKIVGERRVSA